MLPLLLWTGLLCFGGLRLCFCQLHHVPHAFAQKFFNYCGRPGRLRTSSCSCSEDRSGIQPAIPSDPRPTFHRMDACFRSRFSRTHTHATLASVPKVATEIPNQVQNRLCCSFNSSFSSPTSPKMKNKSTCSLLLALPGREWSCASRCERKRTIRRNETSLSWPNVSVFHHFLLSRMLKLLQSGLPTFSCTFCMSARMNYPRGSLSPFVWLEPLGVGRRPAPPPWSTATSSHAFALLSTKTFDISPPFGVSISKLPHL